MNKSEQWIKFATLALRVAEGVLPAYAHKFSPQRFTLPQLAACVLLKEYGRLDWRVSRHTGEKLRLAYWGFSPKPPLTVNSTTYVSEKKYYRWSMPLAQYYDYTLTNSGEIDVMAVPEGREDAPTNSAMPAIGGTAPEISAKDWINSKAPLTLAGLRGKVVVVDFWATWCTPCVAGIPHLNELHHKYAGKNFELLGLVREGHPTMDPFLAKRPVDYPIGLESGSLDKYAITEIPLAVVIDQEGKIIWIGDPASPKMDKVVAKALN
jgi:thiol-disulfide isomerase/thioredoxin